MPQKTVLVSCRHKMQKMQITFFYKITKKKTEMEAFAFCVISFEPFKIQNCSAPQNDGQNFNLVKYIKRVVKKMARNGQKPTIGGCGLGRLPIDDDSLISSLECSLLS